MPYAHRHTNNSCTNKYRLCKDLFLSVMYRSRYTITHCTQLSLGNNAVCQSIDIYLVIVASGHTHSLSSGVGERFTFED